MSRVPRLSPALVITFHRCHRACHGLLIITIDNAITYKAQRDKNARELQTGERGSAVMQMRRRDVAALDADTRRVS